ncbi:MAG: GNAT family N-acetyltransferase [Rhodospirillaceae bacterium]
MSTTIRPWTETDRQAVIDLILPIQQQEFGIDISLQDQPDLIDVPGTYHCGAGQFWVAVDADSQEIIGSIALIEGTPLPDGKRMGILRKMFVRQDHRGRSDKAQTSLADRLMATLLAHGKAQGLDLVVLGTTGVMRAAQQFYRRQGFDALSADDLPENFPRMSCDSMFFQKTF